ncbi:TIM barrel protein [Kineococcus siccus]|uniref:TIM barrel protein n=1 Tax=Kineococcus siccus TaxID=2696567 RepID=UPI00196ACE3C
MSLYSFQEEFFLRTMALRDAVAAAAGMGATDIEIIPEQSIAGFPHVSDAWVAEWHGLMAEFGTRPLAYDFFLDTLLHPHRRLTHEEQVASVRRDIDLAVRLRTPLLRAIISTPAAVLRDAAPYAEAAGVKLLLEVHAPFHYQHPWVLQHLTVMDELDSPALGFMPDLGCFVERFPRVVSDRALREGARPDLVALVVGTYDAHGDTHGLMDTVTYSGGGPVDVALARQATHFTWRDPRSLLEQMHRTHHIQAKFYEMTEDGTEYSIPYDRIVDVLVEGGYRGCLSSEYEGNRHIQDAYPVDSVEQVSRQHAMFERLLQGHEDGRG